MFLLNLGIDFFSNLEHPVALAPPLVFHRSPSFFGIPSILQLLRGVRFDLKFFGSACEQHLGYSNLDAARSVSQLGQSTLLGDKVGFFTI